MKSTTNNHIASLALVAFLMLTSQGYSAVISYWRFDTDSGSPVTNGQAVSSVTDIGSGGFNLTGSTDATYVTNTQFPNPIPQTGASNLFSGEFSGLSSTLGNTSFTAGSGDFTYELFLNKNTNAGTGVLSNSANQFGILTEFGGSDPIRFFLAGAYNVSYGNLINGTTYHVAIVRSGSFDSFYLNGNLLGTENNFGIAVTSGIAVGDGTPFGRSDFTGGIDEIRVSDTALTTTEFLSAVPEPSAALMLGLSAVALVAFRARRRSRSAFVS